MTWNKPEIPDFPPIKKPRILNWFTGFSLYAFFAFTLVWFNRNSEKLWDNFFAYLALFALLYILALAIRIYVYLVSTHEYPLHWAEEIKKIDARWQDWANESMAVIDSCFFTPNSLTAHDISIAEAKISKDEILKLSEDDECPPDELLQHLDSILSQLPKCSLNMLLVANQATLDNVSLINEMESKLKEQLVPHTNKINIPSNLICVADNQVLNQLIDNQADSESLQLIIVYNVNDPNSSEFMGYFLLAPQSLVANHGIKHKSYLLRQLVTDELDKATDQLIEMQPIVAQSQNVWLTHPEIMGALVLLLQKLSAQAETNVGLPEQQKLDLYLGIPSPLSHWLALHFACETAENSRSVELIVSLQEDKTLFNVVVPHHFEEI